MGVGFQARMARNSLQTTAESLPTVVEVIVSKIYCYFHIYTVREERLCEFCEVQSWLCLTTECTLIISNVCYGKNFCILWCVECYFLPRTHSHSPPSPPSFLLGSMSWASVWSPPWQLVVLHTVQHSSSAIGLGDAFRQTATNPSLGN